jgi:type III secretion protein V
VWSSLATQIGNQITTQPRALLLGGGVIALFAAVPGFPVTPFLLLGASVAFVGYRNARRLLRGAAAFSSERVPAAARDGEANAEQVIPVGAAVFALVAIEFREELLVRLSLSELNLAIGKTRLALRIDTGLPFPGVGLRRSARPDADSFWVLLREVPVRRVVSDPTHTPQQAATEIARELEAVLREHAAELIGVQEARNIVALIERRYPDLVREANALLPLPRFAELLQHLVAEGVPVRDVRGILEAVVQHAAPTVTFRGLVNWVRIGLARDISHSLMHEADAIAAVTLTPEAQQQLRETIALDELGDRQLIVAPEDAMRLADDLHELFANDPALPSVLLVPHDLRWALRRLLEPYRPGIRVISQDEVSRGVRVVSRGQASWHGAAAAPASALA